MNVTKDTASDRNVPVPAKTKSKKPEKSEDEIAVDSLMGEIEEDLRGEELSKLWKQYGNLVIGDSGGKTKTNNASRRLSNTKRRSSSFKMESLMMP